MRGTRASVLALGALLLGAGVSACGPVAGSGAAAAPAPVVSAEPVTPTPLATPSASTTTRAPATTPTTTRRSTRPAMPRVTTQRAVAAASTRHYVFPVRGCRTSYAHVHHDYPATDIWAARGCAFVSPVSGVVDEVSYVDRWSPSTNLGSTRGGLSVAVIGTDGGRYYGSHLSSIATGIRPGVHVLAGRLLGRVGATGDAVRVGPHLHFGISWPTAHGIWWVRRGEVYPWSYLDSWRSGGTRSPAAAVRAREAALGRTPACSADC